MRQTGAQVFTPIPNTFRYLVKNILFLVQYLKSTASVKKPPKNSTDKEKAEI